MNVLWISLRAPFDDVRHASGRIHNFYLKKLIDKQNIKLKLITFCKNDEIPVVKKDHEKYRINSDVYAWDTPFIARLERTLVKVNPYDKYGGGTIPFYWNRIKKSLKHLSDTPDVIILDWTEILLFLPKIKTIFPDAKIVSVEEDVLLLNFQRQYENCIVPIKKYILKRRYEKLCQLEIDTLKKCDLVILNNPKDQKLVEKYGVQKTWYWTPYFQNFKNIHAYSKKTKDILYYGSMNRPENHYSVMHLINNIFPHIKDPDARLIILGNGPQDSLLKYQSKRIIMTGFIEDVTPIFESVRCLCAPLMLGAGVKIKIIETMSAGIAVLTNDIGIEGIPAEMNKEYLHCKTDKDFIHMINKILSDDISAYQIGQSARKFIESNYNANKSADIFISNLTDLVECS